MSNSDDRSNISVPGYLFGKDNKSTQRPIKKRNTNPSEKITQTICESESDEEYFDAQNNIFQPSQRITNLDKSQPIRKGGGRNEPFNDASLYEDACDTSNSGRFATSTPVRSETAKDNGGRKSKSTVYEDALDDTFNSDKLRTSTPKRSGTARDNDRRKSTVSVYEDALDDTYNSDTGKVVPSTSRQNVSRPTNDERFFSLQSDGAENVSVYQDAVSHVPETNKRKPGSFSDSGSFTSIHDKETDGPEKKTNESKKSGSGSMRIISNDGSELDFIIYDTYGQ